MKVDSILVDKLDFVTEKSVKSLVERSKTDAELAMAIATTRTETGVQIGEFFIEKQEFDIS